MISHYVVHGSSAQMTGIGDKTCHLILGSPPYFSPAVDQRLKQGKLGNDELPSLEESIVKFAYGLRANFKEVARVLHPGGTVVLQTRDVRLNNRLVGIENVHRNLLESSGLELVSRHFWLPRYTTLSRRRIRERLVKEGILAPHDPEVFLVFKRIGFTQEKPVNLMLSDSILSQPIIKTDKHPQKDPHPHQAPEPVVCEFINQYTKPGDLIIDPFAGGGTTIMCAKRLGRSAVGYETDAIWAERASNKLSLTSAGG